MLTFYRSNLGPIFKYMSDDWQNIQTDTSGSLLIQEIWEIVESGEPLKNLYRNLLTKIYSDFKTNEEAFLYASFVAYKDNKDVEQKLKSIQDAQQSRNA